MRSRRQPPAMIVVCRRTHSVLPPTRHCLKPRSRSTQHQISFQLSYSTPSLIARQSSKHCPSPPSPPPRQALPAPHSIRNAPHLPDSPTLLTNTTHQPYVTLHQSPLRTLSQKTPVLYPPALARLLLRSFVHSSTLWRSVRRPKCACFYGLAQQASTAGQRILAYLSCQARISRSARTPSRTRRVPAPLHRVVGQTSVPH